MKTKLLLSCSLLFLFGCSNTTSYVKTDTTLGRVVVYRNGVAYFERYARIDGDSLNLSVPQDKVDDFLKSLTVVDARTGKPTPIAYPTEVPTSPTGLTEMKIQLQGATPHELKLSYVTEAPSWKPSYRVMLGQGKKVRLEGWAIVDNTSGEDWKNVKLGVGSSSALSFRFDLRSIRLVQRETLHSDDLFAQAPPMGGVAYGGQPLEGGKRLLGELSDDALAQTIAPDVPAADKKHRVVVSKSEIQVRGHSGDGGLGRAGGGGMAANKPAEARYRNVPAQQQQANTGIDSLARSLSNTRNQIIIEGFADKNDKDKMSASLERANRARDQLVRNGVDPSQVVAVGKGEQSGRSGGVRIVEAPVQGQTGKDAQGGESAGEKEPTSSEPIGTSHFESPTSMDVPRGTSAMVSIFHGDTEGEVVYLYDPESARGNTTFPFKSVRIKNPTDSTLESGPVTVFGEGRFIGEGLCEPIPARSVAFVPYALDRQILVEQKDSERDKIARIITVQRGVFSTEMQHTKKTTLTLNNRLQNTAVIYVRHTVPKGYELTSGPESRERIGGAYLFRVEVPAGGKTEVVIEESTPVFKSTDIRSAVGMELIRVYLSSAALEGPIKAAVGKLLELQTEIGNLEQHINTMRDQMGEYRARMDELHVQIVTLKAVKSGGPLMQSLEKKMQEVSDKLSKATIDLVSLQEKLMVARIKFQDGVADLSIEKKEDKKPEEAAPKKS